MENQNEEHRLRRADRHLESTRQAVAGPEASRHALSFIGTVGAMPANLVFTTYFFDINAKGWR